MVQTIEEIKEIAKKITTVKDKANYNAIIKLIKQLEIQNEEDLDDDTVEKTYRFLVVSLFQIFKKLFSRGDLTLRVSDKTTPELKQFKQWCRRTYESFKTKMLLIISDLRLETSLALDSLDLYMQLIELESIHFASKVDAPFFPNKTLKNLMLAIWKSNIEGMETKTSNGQSQNFILLEFLEKYYKPFADIQYYVQSEFNNILDSSVPSSEKELLSHNVSKWLTLMNHDSHCSNANVELEIYVSNPPKAVEDESKFKSFFEKNWLITLNFNLSLEQYKTILLILHKRLIPHFHTPTKLMDFLTESYNLQSSDSNAGVVPILALNGLFELMKRFNLEYPNFYSKLYQLVTPDLMHVKYRARFFRLMDLFLSSSHLSAHLVASFVKRLARYTLDAPPAAIVSVIPFAYNMLRKHPNCMIMLHNPRYISDPFQTAEQTQELNKLKENYHDPFNIQEPNPELTNAMESSLWELATLMDHYHANVATLAKIFGQPFRKISYNMEDFLDWSYDSLLNAESSRKLKILPTLEFEEFDALFDEQTSGDNSKEGMTVYLPGVEW
ncbi:hypothetical protein NCAS_0F03500 [Naumovozyma castellii]|uniref:CCAAT-binding factor domain-containing protein n=1 Tax=Naumovozyma castellii TaxID=27288 RepID=G0VH61_NAUCA|nr:hypothetical protein NCAS_0F03500 [Naumovozyma castellii CBS 4309]CCC70834.1 hypothetical protein NCAS_0F03500 [Naumovozyma castellii CBS 4309]